MLLSAQVFQPDVPGSRGDWALSVAGPSLWNRLPLKTSTAKPLARFKSQLELSNYFCLIIPFTVLRFLCEHFKAVCLPAKRFGHYWLFLSVIWNKSDLTDPLNVPAFVLVKIQPVRVVGTVYARRTSNSRLRFLILKCLGQKALHRKQAKKERKKQTVDMKHRTNKTLLIRWLDNEEVQQHKSCTNTSLKGI